MARGQNTLPGAEDISSHVLQKTAGKGIHKHADTYGIITHTHPADIFDLCVCVCVCVCHVH